jgi:hypothetical protein
MTLVEQEEIDRVFTEQMQVSDAAIQTYGQDFNGFKAYMEGMGLDAQGVVNVCTGYAIANVQAGIFGAAGMTEDPLKIIGAYASTCMVRALAVGYMLGRDTEAKNHATG